MHRTSVLLLALCSTLLLVACNESDLDSPDTTASTDTAIAERSTSATADSQAEVRIVVLGNSIAAGYGLAEDQAFPALLQDRIDDRGWSARVINAGVSGETTAGGLRRLDWILNEPVDVLIIELGGNDGLRGTPVETTRENLQKMIDRTRERQPDARIILAGMQLPPNLGDEYTRQFRELYPELAEENDVELIPFILEGVGGNPRMNQSDGIHPTAEGQRRVAETVWSTLQPVLATLHRDEAPVEESFFGE